jgi:hypothetical protein
MWMVSRIFWPLHGLQWPVISHQGLPLPLERAITPTLELERIKPLAFAYLQRIWWRLPTIAELYRVKKTDKSEIFDLFYGELKTAPLINDCPLCMECKLVEIVESGANEIFIGEIVGTYTEEGFLTDGKLDFRKMIPLILSQPDTSYWRLGEQVASAWNIGKKYKAKRK